MSGISLTASFFIVTLNLFQGLIREMLESIVGENEPKAMFEPYETRRTRLRECPTKFSMTKYWVRK